MGLSILLRGNRLLEAKEQIVDMAVLEAIEKLSEKPSGDIAHHVIDPISIFILGATSKRAMTVAEIAGIISMPTASCYKIVADMENLGLMTRCGSCRTTGRGKAITYTSVVKSVFLEMKGGKVQLHIVLKNGNTMQLTRDMGSNPSAPVEMRSMSTKDMLPLHPPAEGGETTSHLFELSEGARRNKMYP
jgi:hypothetical protein